MSCEDTSDAAQVLVIAQEAVAQGQLAALNIARNNLIAAINAATLKPRPTYNLDGQEFSWGTYMKMMTDALEALDKACYRRSPVKVKWLGRRNRHRWIGYGEY